MKRVLLIITMLFAQTVAAGPSLCAVNEKTYFSCSAGPERKLASLCGSKSLQQPNSYLQYRFGTKKNLELIFPDDKKDSLVKFNYYHYFRFQTDRTNISFTNKDTSYAIFSDYDGENGTPTLQRGVSVSRNKDVRFLCKGKVTNNLSSLEGAIPCDKSDPLNSCTVGL